MTTPLEIVAVAVAVVDPIPTLTSGVVEYPTPPSLIVIEVIVPADETTAVAAAPVTTGVLALYLQSNPRASQKQVKRWLRKSGSKVSSYFFDRNTDDSQTSYWTDSFNLRGSEKRILFNPYSRSPDAPNVPNISISGVSFAGISISNQ